MSSHMHTARPGTRSGLRTRAAMLGAVCLLAAAGLIQPSMSAVAAVQPAGTKVYVPNTTSGSLSVVDAAADTVVKTIPVGPGPTAVAFAPALDEAFVTVRGENCVKVIDTTTDTVEATIPVGTAPTSAVVDPAGTTLFVANSAGHSVSVIDTATGGVVTTLQISGEPGAMAVSPTGQALIVADATGGTLTTVTIGANRDIFVAGTTDLGGSGLRALAFDAGGYVLYAIHQDNPALGQPSLDAIDYYHGGVTSIPLGAYPHPASLAITPDGTRVYLAQGGGPAVAIDTTTDTVAGTVGVFFYSPAGIVIDSAGTRAYLSDSRADNIAVIDLSTNAIIARIGGLTRPGAASVLTPRYPFAGFFPPIDSAGLNTARAGQVVPLRFSLGGDRGLDVFALGFPTVQRISCGTGIPLSGLVPAQTAGKAGLRYDAASRTYTFAWKPANAWSGTCRRLLLGLNDGSRQTADFILR